MKRRAFVASLFAAPLLIKEALSVQKKNWWDYNGMNPDFAYPYTGPGLTEFKGESWIEFEVPFTKMNWEMDVKDFGEHTYTMFGLPLPEFYKDPFRRTRKNGLIKLGKARR